MCPIDGHMHIFQVHVLEESRNLVVGTVFGSVEAPVMTEVNSYGTEQAKLWVLGSLVES